MSKLERLPAAPEGVLAQWTIYDHPTDHPDLFVARRFDIGQGVFMATSHLIGAKDIEALRETFRRHGMACLPRLAEDEPQIVEVWM